MSAWRILLTDGLEENGQAILRQYAQVDERTGITAEELLQVIGEYDAMIVRGRTKVTAAVFDAGKSLKVVGRAGVGVDNIDLNAAKAHGVTVVNSPTATTLAVAELTLALMLAVVREIPRADAGMKAGKWLKKEMEVGELWKKTLGVIGFGRIGAAVAQRAAAFDMNILGYDPLIPAEEIKARGGQPVSFDELLAQSDYISLHLPKTKESTGMIGAEQFAKMKNGVRIVNCARGGIVSEDALYEALTSGKVAGAALDVFNEEPPTDWKLAKLDNVIASPHIGAATREAQARVGAEVAEKLIAFSKNGK